MPKKTAAELAASRAKSNANLLKGGPEHTQFKAGRQQVEIARKGGLASQKKFREQRTAREMLSEIMSYKPVLTNRLRDGIIGMGADPDKGDYTAGFLGFVALQQKCMQGDVRALQMWMEITGQDPKTLLQQEALEIEKEALQQGVSGYSALDDAFGKLGSDAP